ncbi:MAG: DNA-protecting protein DprA [Deltaproteobacteria bacterium]|nr:DNA-protecting protein DprA [Deltaproteobacteria bacterium]
MDERHLWLALRTIPHVGNVTIRRLIDHFGTPAHIFSARLLDLMQVDGLSLKSAQAIAAFKPGPDLKIKIAELDAMGVSLVGLTDPDYPANLRRISDPPAVLYVRGELGPGTERAVAIVGTREATNYGLKVAHEVARDLALNGLTVVSGMAKGIDSAAHQGALAGQGRTIAVFGTGIDVIYPPENKLLFQNILRHGAAVTEFPPGTQPEGRNFPIRNRIISGLSLGVVVVEAAPTGGALITARQALEQGREVFAIPGSVHSFKSAGTNDLIRQGAKLVERAQDILDELPYLKTQTPTRAIAAESGPETALQLDGLEKVIVDALGPDEVHIDNLIRQLNIPSPELLSILSRLEIEGLVGQLPGKRFYRK